MAYTRLRSGSGEGSMIFRRLRILRHRTARWFLPPVRAGHDAAASRDDREAAQEHETTRGMKPRGPLP
jgi:hypothetical protein